MNPLDDVLQRVKLAISLVDVVKRSGVALKQEGAKLKGLCPFHSEKTPSFTVFPGEDQFRCFGCGQRGDVVDYVQHHRKLDFWGAFTALANEAGIALPEREPEDVKLAEERRSISETLETFAASAHKALLEDAGALAYLQARGFTQETILERGIGLATYKGAIQAGNTAGAVAAGLLDRDTGSPTVNGRLVFPVRKGGKIVNLSCRTLKDEKPKYRNLNELAPFPADSHLLRTAGKVALVEGVVDAWLMQQADIKSVPTIGTYFKPEWLALCGKSTEFVCCYDNDANEAGQKGNRNVADILFEAGLRVCIADLPDGMDPADIIQSPQFGAAALARYINAALPYVDWLIQRLPQPRGPQELTERLDLVLFPKLLKMPPVSVDGYLDQIAKNLSVRKVTLRQQWEAFQKTHRASAALEKKSDETTEAEVVWRDDDPIMFNPSQWFGKGRGVFTVYVESTQGLMPVIITSDRQMKPLNADVARELGLVFRDNKYPSEQIRWPVGKRYTNSVKSWLDSAEQVDGARLYMDVRSLTTRHIHMPLEWDAVYDLLTLWTLGTYVYQLFDSYPYVHVRALPDSGKSTLLTLLSSIAFNGLYSTAISESVVTRTANSDSPAMFIDEAENYKAKTNDEISMIFEVLKGGYKRGAVARKAGDKSKSYRPECFDTYCPKMFGSTQPIDPILATRCIDVPLEKTDQQVEAFLPEEIELILKEMRGHAYCWALSQWENVRDAYVAVKPRAEWINRSFEIWKPMLALAAYFSACTGENIEAKLETLSTELRRQKAEREREQNASQRIITEIIDFIRAHEKDPTGDWYVISMLVDTVKSAMGWERYTPEQFSRFVFDEAHLADRGRDKKKLTHGMFSRQVPCIRLDKRTVWEQAVKLFGFDKEILAEIEGTPNINAGIAGLPKDPFD